MNYTIDMPRKTFDGLCAYLQCWGGIYSIPGAVVLKGSIRQRGHVAGAVAEDLEADLIASSYNVALNSLGRCRTTKTQAFLDLRDLSEDEQNALTFVSRFARLKPQQTKVLVRFESTLSDFLNLPAMVRIALSAKE